MYISTAAENETCAAIIEGLIQPLFVSGNSCMHARVHNTFLDVLGLANFDCDSCNEGGHVPEVVKSHTLVWCMNVGFGVEDITHGPRRVGAK